MTTILNHAIQTTEGRVGWAVSRGKRGWAEVRYPGEGAPLVCMPCLALKTVYAGVVPLEERWA
ncbi:hypothetical protein SDC9_66608 [bioreactor metagenome]|uniref:Uncharacterized protein n=1 Tax=bioreactor metagenome TaxID=1076179 RepID=A0A644XVS0_9ZZZZ